MDSFDKIKALGLKVKNKDGVFIDPKDREELRQCVFKKKVSELKDEPLTLYDGWEGEK